MVAGLREEEAVEQRAGQLASVPLQLGHAVLHLGGEHAHPLSGQLGLGARIFVTRTEKALKGSFFYCQFQLILLYQAIFGKETYSTTLTSKSSIQVSRTSLEKTCSLLGESMGERSSGRQILQHLIQR